MAHKYVSNKATLKNESKFVLKDKYERMHISSDFFVSGFLSKLSSTLTSRIPPAEALEKKTTSLTWHKTSEVKERIKTASGTIAVYDDTPEEEIERIKESVKHVLPLGEKEKSPDVATTIIAEAASVAALSMGVSILNPFYRFKTSKTFILFMCKVFLRVNVKIQHLFG